MGCRGWLVLLAAAVLPAAAASAQEAPEGPATAPAPDTTRESAPVVEASKPPPVLKKGDLLVRLGFDIGVDFFNRRDDALFDPPASAPVLAGHKTTNHLGFGQRGVLAGFGATVEKMVTDGLGGGGVLTIGYRNPTDVGSPQTYITSAQQDALKAGKRVRVISPLADSGIVTAGPRLSYTFLNGWVRPYVALEVRYAYLIVPNDSAGGHGVTVTEEDGVAFRVDRDGSLVSAWVGYTFGAWFRGGKTVLTQSIPFGFAFGRTF